MKFGKKSIIFTIVILILLSFLYFWDKEKKAKLTEENKQKMAYTVKLGNIKSEVKVTAIAKLANEQKLSFGQEGKITNVYVKVGDEVKSGKILAELNMDDYQNAVKTSQLELENAKLGLIKLLNNDISLRESQLNSQINEAKSNFSVEIEQEKVLETQLNTTLKQKKDKLEQMLRDYTLAKKNIEISKSGLSVNSKIETEQTKNSLKSRTQTLSSITNSLNSSLGDIELIIESIDKIFGVSDKFRDDNNSFENFLGVKNNSTKLETETNIFKGYNLVKNYRAEFNKINSEMTDDEIYNLITQFYLDTASIIVLCDTAIDSIDQSVESIGNLTSTMLSTFKTTINNSRTSLIGLRTTLNTFSSSINSLLSSSSQENKLQLSIDQKEFDIEKQQSLLKKQEADLVSQEEDIENMKTDNINQINRKKSQLSALLDKIDVLKKELNDLLDGADEYDIKQQNNLIGQAKLRLERTIDQKDNYQIIAEFDGRVRSLDIVEGEQYKLDDRKYIVIENPELIELELQVSQIDIVKIKEKDPVIITLDAYPNRPINAKISSRSVNPEPNQRGGVYYKTTILIEKQELEILAGMSALVSVITSKAENVLLIPTLSLFQEGSKKFVYIKEGENYKIHEIKTGVTNNFQAEVTEGLKEGDIIKSSVLDEKAFSDMGIDEGSSKIFGN